jgi:hypothetical protein
MYRQREPKAGQSRRQSELIAGSTEGSPWRATRPGEGTDIAWARTRPQRSRRFEGLGSRVSIAWTAMVKPLRTDSRRPPTP